MASEKHSLAGVWARKYVQKLVHGDQAAASSSANRSQTAEKILTSLRFCSSRAWSKTEELLLSELKRHRMTEDLIDPWKIAEDSRQLFKQAAEAYQAELTPERFSVVVAPLCGEIRQSYTAKDPRVLGFLSMQFHYTGQFLLAELSEIEQRTVGSYLKVMDDNLYMPLHRSYEAASNHDFHSPALGAVQQLLPASTQIAQFICTEVAGLNFDYRSCHGPLSDFGVRISSIRDVEMFQIYLCLCVLEGNIAVVQQELFPLCVMLYPPLKVDWTLVRQLVSLLSQEIQKRCSPQVHGEFAPYLQAFEDMFAEDIFPEDNPIWSHHPDTIKFMDEARDILQNILGQSASAI